MRKLDHAISQLSRSSWLIKAPFALASFIAVSLFSSIAPAASVESHREFRSSTEGETQSRRSLTIEERIAYQWIIEEVYWRHRIWPEENPKPKPPLDQVVPSSALQAKVEDYLKKSLALAVYWQKPITAEELQAEIERMASQTKRPEMLRELWQALGNDPYVIAECLARPLLAARQISALNERYPEELQIEQPEWLRALFAALGQDHRTTGNWKRLFDEAWTTTPSTLAVEAAAGAADYRLPEILAAAPSCMDNTWVATSLAGVPTERFAHTAVWTGTEMIVWGGTTGPPPIYFNTGGRYDPVTDSWVATSLTGAPSARYFHTAVWTGTEMIVWGGGDPSTNTGGRYNPATDTWVATSLAGAPSERNRHSAVWTETEMIVWGGFPNTNTGGRYNPATDSWVATSLSGAPSARSFPTAVWMGTEMIVWGGTSFAPGLNSGGRYCASPPQFSKAQITSPPPGSTLTSSPVTFAWNTGAGVSEYWLEIGTSLGGGQIYSQSQGTNLSVTVSGLPTNGSTVYVRLWSRINGVWEFNDYSYTATS